LFVAGNSKEDYSIFQIKDLMYGSQIPDPSLELMAGYGLERPDSNLKVYEPELRNYVLAQARELIAVKNNTLSIPKKLPRFFSDVYELEESHLKFFQEEELKSPLKLGKVRSGSKILNIDVNVDATEVLKHHILIPATTGRGKSNLVKTILYDTMENDKVGKLVFDPHNEYYGTIVQKGLRDHPKSNEFLDFYTARQIPGAFNLRFNLQLINPGNILDSLYFTEPQTQALIGFYRLHNKNWLNAIFSNDDTQFRRPEGLDARTFDVIRRKVGLLLNIIIDDQGDIIENGIYTKDGHEQILHDIFNALTQGKTVIIDTSLFGGAEEIFIASIIVEYIFNQYKRLKFRDQLQNQPVITIVIEEAPRVIGKKVLDKIDNVFGKIAREGRKFQIGLIAITQLPSIIEREILANMNTKIILGNEMGPERRAIIESAAQDLSDDYQTIGSLDKGEAIITSNFTKFAIPIKIPLFEDFINTKKTIKKEKSKVRKRSPGFD
jgi:DNA helicase HerA-like ATPase